MEEPVILSKPLLSRAILTEVICSGRGETRLQKTPLTPSITYFSFLSSVETHADETSLTPPPLLLGDGSSLLFFFPHTHQTQLEWSNRPPQAGLGGIRWDDVDVRLWSVFTWRDGAEIENADFNRLMD